MEYLGLAILSNSLFPGYIWELKTPLMTKFPVVFIFTVLRKSPSVGGRELRARLRSLMQLCVLVNPHAHSFSKVFSPSFYFIFTVVVVCHLPGI